MLRGLAVTAAYRLQGLPVTRLWREYEARQWWPAEQLADYSAALLRRSVEFAAAHVPHYQVLGRGAELAGYPVLTRAGLGANKQRLCASAAAASGARWVNTSGSAGKRVDVLLDRLDRAQRTACAWRGDCVTGLAPWARTAYLWGGEYFDKRGWGRAVQTAGSWLNDRHVFYSYTGDAATLRQTYAALARLRPQRITAYSSGLSSLALYIEQHRLPPLGARMLVSTAMHLEPQHGARIQSSIGQPLLERFGTVECGPLAFQCEAGGWHSNSDYVHLEVLRADGSIAREGRGSLLLTTLHNRAMPLLRYEVGDIVDLADPAVTCACGRGLPLLRSFVGRCFEEYVAPDGTVLSWFGLYRAAGGTPLAEWQVLDLGAGRLRYLMVSEATVTRRDGASRAVEGDAAAGSDRQGVTTDASANPDAPPARDFTAADIALIRQRLRAILPDCVDFELEVVDRLFYAKSGKRVRMLRLHEIEPG